MHNSVKNWSNFRNQYILDTMSEDKSDTKVELGLLEEDDEFEEFPADTVKAAEEDKEANVWEDNWDDDNVEDDFATQLR